MEFEEKKLLKVGKIFLKIENAQRHENENTGKKFKFFRGEN
ncbi:MAG: hypothetical protein CM15mV43_800 [uncultured marine virus]|nr:MAG: hypothetical protein CM15mV43_800 [uncultured marine virus]